MKFKNIPNKLKPRERLVALGKENLSDDELLSIILKTGTKNKNVKELALDILTKYSNVVNLKDAKFNQLLTIEGIGKAKATEILACIELGRRIYENTPLEQMIECTNPSNIISYFNYLFKDKQQEEFYVIYLDNKKRYIDKKLLFKGSINFSIAHPREIFKEAYLLSSSYIICIHNHPSGDATPSKADNELTNKIKEIGLIHSIPLVDHLIIGKSCYYSYYENNKI